MADTVTTKRRDPEDVRRALRGWLSERLGGKALDDLQVAPPQGHGYSNDTFLVDAVVDDAPMPLVVQAAPTAAGLFPEYPIERMARIQQDLRDHTDVPVANVRWLEEDPKILDAPFYVMDRLDGRVPDESPKSYHAAGWVAVATAEQRRLLWLSMLDSMAELHRVDVAGHFGYLRETRWGMDLDADPAAERVRQWRDYTVWASDDDEPPPKLMGAWDALQATLPPRPNVLSISWGDAKLGNVMFRGFDVVALLDWELCGIGPAEEDLMNQLAVDAVLAELFKVPRIDGFLTREETVASYEKRLGREMVGTNWWHVFALAKMAAEIHRILRQTLKLGGKRTDVDLERVNSALPPLQRALETLGKQGDTGA
jgi:aminoglycoside phosphotransferase (APT) family kinase protein